jgi:hypothetical protein
MDLILSIVIVNYNGKQFFDACLRSITEHVPVEHEVIVVDNASTDGSVEYLRSAYPGIRLIESDCNLGFTGGNNLGARYAVGRYLLLLNNDTVIRTSVVPLLNMMNSDAHIGVLGCRLFYGDGRQQESVGYMPTPLSLILSWTPLARVFPESSKCRCTVRADSTLYTQSYREVEWVSGAFLMTRPELWKSIGGLDEQYFMYMEDTDYCRRVHDMNYKIIYSADCEVIHFVGAGRSWVGERALLNTTNSNEIYLYKFYGKVPAVLLRIFLVPIFVARSIAFFSANVLARDQVKKEKAAAYWRVALKLLFMRDNSAKHKPKRCEGNLSA